MDEVIFNKYLKFLENKYNIKEEMIEMYVKDNSGNIKLTKKLGKKVQTNCKDWEEFLKLNNLNIDSHIVKVVL